MPTLVNAVVYQIGWFTCVLTAASGISWVGTLVALGLIALHLKFTERPAAQLKLIAVAAVVGAVWDSVPVSLGLLSYSDGTVIRGLAPHWIVALWALFSTTLNYSLRWLTRSPLAAIGLGAVGGPLAYAAAARMGALQLLQPTRALTIIGLGWSVLLPLLCRLARQVVPPQSWPAVAGR
jgi:hypothetical protein